MTVDGDDIYWIEGRPNEAGRNALVRRSADGAVSDVTPRELNVRTRVHEYGGRAYVVHDGVVYFSNFSDQRVYRQTRTDVVALTPEGKWFYGDPIVDAGRRRLLCVREDHSGSGEAVTTLVTIPLDRAEGPGTVIASGYDFYSTPRLSPDGHRLAWICWRHPQMPWDGTELWVADVGDAGAIDNARHIAGSDHESIYQCGWSPDGGLYFASDRTGWWRLYACDAGCSNEGSEVVRDPPSGAEFGQPQWLVGTTTWMFAGASRIVASYTQRGRWHLALVDAKTGTWRSIAPDLQPHDWLTATTTHAILVGGWSAKPDAVVQVDLDSGVRRCTAVLVGRGCRSRISVLSDTNRVFIQSADRTRVLLPASE